MLHQLAKVCRRARRSYGIRIKDIAELADVDRGVVMRFEHAQTWPRETDALVQAYAASSGLTTKALWLAAVERLHNDH